MSQRYPYSKHLPKANVLKQLVFDEGIAHFLSYKEDVLSLDWHTDKMNNRRESVYQKLRYYLTQEYALTPEILESKYRFILGQVCLNLRNVRCNFIL